MTEAKTPMMLMLTDCPDCGGVIVQSTPTHVELEARACLGLQPLTKAEQLLMMIHRGIIDSFVRGEIAVHGPEPTEVKTPGGRMAPGSSSLQ
jgi:hypothetical protein